MRYIIFSLVLLVLCSTNVRADINELRQKALTDDPVAKYDLAIYYLKDENTNTNYIEVLRLLRESSKLGYKQADNIISELCNTGYDGWGDYTLIRQYDDGILSDEVKNHLEDWGVNGCGVKDCKGHKGYLLVLAHALYNEKKYNKAIYFYNLSLSQMKEGNLGQYHDEDFNLDFALMDAYIMLGFCYEHGSGTEKDYKKALDYYLIGSVDVDIDTPGIESILREIGNQELAKGQYYSYGLDPYARRPLGKIGVMCIKLGLYSQAKETLGEESSEMSNDPIPALWIGEMFYKGLGRKVNYTKAFEYFNHIVNFMEGPWGTDLYEYYPDIYADACYRLYECYAYGRGVGKEDKQAEKYFNLALKFGSSSALYDDQRRYEIVGN